MRNRASGFVLAGLFSAACALSSPAQNLNLSFNTDTFSPNFTVDLNGTATTTNWLWGASAGPGSPAGGGVRVATQSDLTAEYNPSTFNLSADTTTISLEFKTTTTPGGSGDKPLQLGFLAGQGTSFNDTAPYTSYAFLSFRIFGDGSVGFQTKASTGSTVSTSIAAAGTVTFTDWLKASLTLTAVNGVTGSYNYSVGIWDLGANGTSTPTVLLNPATTTGSVIVPDFASTASGLTAFAGWRSTMGNPNFADFSVTVVPEPSTLALAAIGLGLFMLRRSRS
jgi:hypothetical protein